MIKKIVFFNHYHRGDLHTHKEFLRQVIDEVKDVEFEYLHNNPEKLLIDLNIKTAGTPDFLERKNALYKQEDVLYVNTWVGSQWDVFCKHGGINMHTLYEQWGKIFNAINKLVGSNLKLRDEKESYLPTIDYSHFDLTNVKKYIEQQDGKFLVLLCNNVPNSSQSFQEPIDDLIIEFAQANPDLEIICTDEVDTDLENIKYTDQIIGCRDGCDLQEISYLSTYCDVIIGKNSGPFVFCETRENYMDPSKRFYSFNAKHPEYDDIKETMSNGLKIECKYKTNSISNILNLSLEDREKIRNVFNEVASIYEKA